MFPKSREFMVPKGARIIFVRDVLVFCRFGPIPIGIARLFRNALGPVPSGDGAYLSGLGI